MTQYINKDTLVAEIENLIKRAEAEKVLYPKTIKAAKNYLLIEDYKKLLSIIDTLEVKEVGIDLGNSKGDKSVKHIIDTKTFEVKEMGNVLFKVKYAGSEYNVLEVKDIAGVTFYGIEDEPNHIDYVQSENCEIISNYAIKENGSL